ncbi:MAG: hypothetical protein WCP01_12315 [Methylococcaceae bacterium]
MYRVEQPEPTEEFKQAWSSAGRYIQNQADSGFNWLRANLNPPMAEHLSFRIGNQIFFVFVEAAEFNYKAHSILFDKVCKEANAIPCLMPMSKLLGKWRPKNDGWGFINADSKKAINPLDFVSDELIEMTDWELHDFAIQVVSAGLEKEGKKIFSKQPSREIDPSIWFQDETGPHYVVVRAARYPETEISLPKNIDDIKLGCSKMSKSGYFAPVILANSEDPFDPNAKSNGNFLPLYRGVGMFPKYSGISAL